jgi:hypothetical protein
MIWWSGIGRYGQFVCGGLWCWGQHFGWLRVGFVNFSTGSCLFRSSDGCCAFCFTNVKLRTFTRNGIDNAWWVERADWASFKEDVAKSCSFCVDGGDVKFGL